MSFQLEREFSNNLWTVLYATMRKLTDFANAILVYNRERSSLGRDTAGEKHSVFMQEIYLHLMFGLLNHKIKLEYGNGNGKLDLQIQEGTLGTKEISCAESSRIKRSSDYAAVS